MVKAGHSPSIRLFEAASCGSPILSDVWEGLDDLFAPGREILFARTTQDVIGALALKPAIGRAIGAAARRRVLAAHTPDHRAATLEAALRRALAGRAGRRPTTGSDRTEAVSA
jgi:spore maturation protein CgeB